MNNSHTHLQQPKLAGIILWAGSLVGTLDILSAFVNAYLSFNLGPVFILKYVAMGLFGKAAITGGADMAVYGLLIHYAIAFTWTILFFLIYRPAGLITVNKILTGILYGLFIFLVMNFIMVPYLSHMPQPKAPFHFTLQVAINAVILMVMIGLPLSFIAHNYFSKTAKR